MRLWPPHDRRVVVVAACMIDLALRALLLKSIGAQEASPIASERHSLGFVTESPRPRSLRYETAGAGTPIEGSEQVKGDGFSDSTTRSRPEDDFH